MQRKLFMSYEEFKEKLLKELQEYYGGTVEVEICAVKKNHGKSYDGVQIIMDDSERSVVPVISLGGLYEAYSNGSMDIINAWMRSVRNVKSVK